MAEERDPLVSRRYRELGGEEPPPALDERILDRSRRRRSFQWHGPLAAAAVIVLAVAVTVHVERGQHSPESSPALEASQPPRAKEAQEARPAQKPQRAEPPANAPPPPAAPQASTSGEEARSRRDAVSPPQAPPPAPHEAPARRAREAQRAPAAGVAADEASKPMASLGKLAEQSPERWLEGIAELRAQGRHEEADESLKRFRERYRDYRVSEEMKAKIEKN